MRIIQRNLRDASNPFELPEDIFRRMYRLNVDAARNLLDEMLPFFENGTRRTRCPPIVRFFCTLSFLAHGSYQKPVGADRLTGLSQAAVSRSIREVVDIFVNHLANRYIRFPQNLEEKMLVKHG